MNDRQLLLKLLNQNSQSVEERMHKEGYKTVSREMISSWVAYNSISKHHREYIEEFIEKYKINLLKIRNGMKCKSLSTLSTQ